MDYATARSRIKTGDVLAWSFREGFFSSWRAFKINMIRVFRRSEYSHVGIAVVLAGRVFVLESVTGGIRLMPLSKELPCYWIAHTELTEDGLNRAMSVCGEPYSNLEAMLGALDQTDDTNGKWQCAEFVCWAKGFKCKATPDEVVEHCLKDGYPLVYVGD